MYGGPDEQGLANIVHGNSKWATATELRNKLYTGGLRFAYEHGEGEKQDEKVLFVVGKKGTGWGGGVLDTWRLCCAWKLECDTCDTTGCVQRA